MNNDTGLTPFRIDIPQADLDDLRERLARTRWPIPAPDRDDRDDFRRGIPLPFLAELADYWRDGFDWREQEAKLNEHEQFTTVVDGQTFHVVHVRSANAAATPLLLCHGWPGSFVEYERIIPLLTDRFHVVIPSPPGFGFSTPLSASGWELGRTTDAYADVMTRLGYERFAVHGTDIGSGIAGRLAGVFPQRVIGTHLGVDRMVLGVVGDKFPMPDGLTDEEAGQLAALQASLAAESGYLGMHQHRPDTIGPALTDSPVALLAWIGEKFKTRRDDGHHVPTVDRDQLLTTVALYWFTRSGASSPQFYYGAEHTELAFAFAPEVPSAWIAFDTHPIIRRALDPWGAVTRWTDHASGGHFPAMEEPELLAGDIRDFFDGLE
ncbi:epoxide hydrolase family protein [Microbacterium sp. SSM24]|uniref:epoxide hydrolase family protein n=1 Tax=Microbacterium sp. SSM24 TaxID=2991714 RepID=UPI002226722B|nr:epoxide hydrolase family protein [Microbacterium sp. SSM24]MCW3493876.1 epoxide hydrolase 1 [Microbacterium sp. SSM24]